MSQSNEALISLLVFSKNGEDLIQKVFSHLKQKLKITKCSSIYQVQGEYNKFNNLHDLRNLESFLGLSFVLKVHTTMSCESLLQEIAFIKEELLTGTNEQSVELKILTFSDQVKMTPSLILPYHNFHKRPELLMPAAEIWPEYIHPILNDNLKKLSANHALKNWGEFYSQAESLLDFSSHQT